jgi:hypothetical protein
MARRIVFWTGAVAVAPVVAASLVSLGAEIYSLAVRPVSLSFRFFAQEHQSESLRPLSAGVACSMLVGSVAFLYVLRRVCRRDEVPGSHHP